MNELQVVEAVKAKAVAAVGSAISVAAKIAGNPQSLRVCLEQGTVLIKQGAVPERPPGFALLKLLLAGVCNTDLELLRGYYNFSGSPGHEFVAQVVSCDDSSLLNRRVVGEINLTCGTCDYCMVGLSRHCCRRSVLGILNHPGAFAEYFTLPEQNLHIVPESVSDEEAVFTEPLAAACEILEQVPLNRGIEVAVLGDGKLGLLITQVLLAHNLRVTLYGKHESKLTLARYVGATALMATNLPNAAYSCVVECTGSSQGLAGAIQMTSPRGTVVMKSTIHNHVSLDMAPVIVNEISLVGSRCGPFDKALDLLARRMVNVKPMIAAEFPLAQADKAFQLAATRGTLKVVLNAKDAADSQRASGVLK